MLSSPRGGGGPRRGGGGWLAVRNILIDGFNLGLAQGSGIATYARNLALATRELGLEPQILYGPRNPLGRNNRLNEAALFEAEAPDRPAWRERLLLAQRLGRAAVSPLGRTAIPVYASGELLLGSTAPPAKTLWAARDVFRAAGLAFRWTRAFTPLSFAGDAAVPEAAHWTCPLSLVAPNIPNLYTIHDLAPLTLPWATLDNKRAAHALLARLCARADHIVTVSEASRAEIIRTFGIDEARITNTYQAVDIPAQVRERPEAEVAGEVERLYALPWQGYFLFFGAIEPKKNLARLIEAYLTANVAARLVVVGAPAWLAEQETALIRTDLNRDERIRRFGHLSLTMLASLIRGAKAVLFPSVYEGFGLPALEAMQLGAPVLASTGGSLPEVVGEAALLVDPFDVDAIRKAIEALDADADLRGELSRRGPIQAERFSPAAYRQRLSKLYTRVL